MTERTLQYRRVHNLLLIQKHLTLREGSSPLTLVLDSIEQSAKPLIQRYIRNAKISKVDTIFISYETLKPPPDITTFIIARRKSSSAVQQEISAATFPSRRTLIIIDTLHPLATTVPPHLPAPPPISSLLSSPKSSLLLIYHTDIPRPFPKSPTTSPYAPAPLTLLRYLATTILTLHSFPQVLARKRAAEKSLAEPVFGIAEEREGVVAGLGGNASAGGVVLEMECRRKSGRGVEEWFFLPAASAPAAASPSRTGEEKIILLDDHPLYNRSSEMTGVEKDDGEGGAGMEVSTFDLGLTAKQRRDREGVVLPYFDAQAGEGGTGGRILYDLGVEDDFDEEEDEI